MGQIEGDGYQAVGVNGEKASAAEDTDATMAEVDEKTKKDPLQPLMAIIGAESFKGVKVVD